MSEIRANTISDAAGTGPVTLTKQSAAKAWAYSVYAAGVPANTASFNVSSLTDVAVGAMDTNFTNSFSSVNYAIALGSQFSTAAGAGAFFTQNDVSGKTVSANRFNHFQAGATADPTSIHMAAMGDLA